MLWSFEICDVVIVKIFSKMLVKDFFSRDEWPIFLGQTMLWITTRSRIIHRLYSTRERRSPVPSFERVRFWISKWGHRGPVYVRIERFIRMYNSLCAQYRPRNIESARLASHFISDRSREGTVLFDSTYVYVLLCLIYFLNSLRIFVSPFFRTLESHCPINNRRIETSCKMSLFIWQLRTVSLTLPLYLKTNNEIYWGDLNKYGASSRVQETLFTYRVKLPGCWVLVQTSECFLTVIIFVKYGYNNNNIIYVISFYCRLNCRALAFWSKRRVWLFAIKPSIDLKRPVRRNRNNQRQQSPLTSLFPS